MPQAGWNPSGAFPWPFFPSLIFSPCFVSSVLIVWLQDEADEFTDLAGNKSKNNKKATLVTEMACSEQQAI